MREVSIGAQGFEEMRKCNAFYVDKTAFIPAWWRSLDQITLICRPRRFGKTLALDTVRCFLSLDFTGRGQELFGGLNVWRDEGMRSLQGTVPVVFLSFAACKAPTLEGALASMKQVIRVVVRKHDYLLESTTLNEDDRALLSRVSDDMNDVTAVTCVGQLCSMLERHWGTKPVVLLDEYDAPMQEAWSSDYWDGMSFFVRQLFNATFKTNPSLGRGLITGITRVASESIFSDLNNPLVVTTVTKKYETAFGFTEAEVATALEEYGIADHLQEVRGWYDGFVFGGQTGIYNPWSITNYLDQREFGAYWANSSSNALVDSLVRMGSDDLKMDFEALLRGEAIHKKLSEQVSFFDLEYDDDAVWSLLLALGYVRANSTHVLGAAVSCELSITNREVLSAFERLVRKWFARVRRSYNEFVRALLDDRVAAMTRFLNDVAIRTFSTFDSGSHPSVTTQPERFWHGFVIGLLVDLRNKYQVLSNRESGYGRYDVMLVPLDEGPAVVMEFKVVDSDEGEATLGDAVRHALEQIAQKHYDEELISRGIPASNIRHYGIAFQGKVALVG